MSQRSQRGPQEDTLPLLWLQSKGKNPSKEVKCNHMDTVQYWEGWIKTAACFYDTPIMLV
jgi:hypothetical protein